LKERWEARGYRVAQFAFADALREVCSIVFGFTSVDFSDGARKETVRSPIMGGDDDDWTPRRALQFVGTDLFRLQVHEDIWVRVARHRIEKLLTEVDVVVVTDARFLNEIRMCHEFENCCSIFVARPSQMPRVDTHESERFVQMMEENSVRKLQKGAGCVFLGHAHFDYVLFNEELDELRRTLTDTFPIPLPPHLGFSDSASHQSN